MSPSPFPLCGHWSAGSDSSFVLNHPGVQSQPVLPTPLFRQAPKIIESVWNRECHGTPISPLTSFFFYIPSLPLTFCTPLSSPISSLWLFFFFFLFPLLNLCRPPIPHCKGIFCTALMERLLSNKGARTVEQRQQIGSFVGSLKGLFHHGQMEREKGWERRRVWVRFIGTPSFQRKVRCVFNRG